MGLFSSTALLEEFSLRLGYALLPHPACMVHLSCHCSIALFQDLLEGTSLARDHLRSHVNQKGVKALGPLSSGMGIPLQRMMNTTDAGSQHAQENLLAFSLSRRLLKDNQKLVVDLAQKTAMLICSETDGGERILTQQQFSPQGMSVLLLLLQAYPRYCPYEALLTTLFPLSPEEACYLMEHDREATIRRVRRAIRPIQDPLRAFGFRVSTVLGAGYLLTPLPQW